MVPADVPDVLDAQEAGGVIGLADVFPQDRYPFPRHEVGQRWLREIDAPDVDCYVVTVDAVVSGFAATRGDELLHFGIAPDHWGRGLAQVAHDALLERMHARGVRQAWLTVFTANTRGRRFYEGLGWRPTGATTRSVFPPRPELQRYERALDRPATPGR